jgi:hypothetical protein
MFKHILKKCSYDDLIGSSGTICLLSAYGCTTYNIIENKKILDIMNMYGALAVGFNCWCKKTYPPLVLETAWFGIAFSSFIHSYYRYDSNNIK